MPKPKVGKKVTKMSSAECEALAIEYRHMVVRWQDYAKQSKSPDEHNNVVKRCQEMIDHLEEKAGQVK